VQRDPVSTPQSRGIDQHAYIALHQPAALSGAFEPRSVCGAAKTARQEIKSDTLKLAILKSIT
jgi:hypothetical protein